MLHTSTRRGTVSFLLARKKKGRNHRETKGKTAVYQAFKIVSSKLTRTGCFTWVIKSAFMLYLLSACKKPV